MLERLEKTRTGKNKDATTPRGVITPPEKPSELRRRRSVEAGGPTAKSKTEAPKEDKPAEEQRVMVRAGGFQWIDRQAKGDAMSQVTEEVAQQTPVTDASRTSFRKSSTHRKSHGRDSPPRSGSRKGYTPSQTPRVDQQ